MDYDVITLTRFGEIMKPLVGRFKKQASDQLDSYYDIFKKSDADLLEKAARHLMMKAIRFPTPDEILIAMREIRSKEYREGNAVFKALPSCSRCREGYVKYSYTHTRKNNSTVERYGSFPCGFCNLEPNGLPHHIQVSDQIYTAARRMPGSRYMWLPDTNNRTICMDLTPCYESKTLEEYYQQEKDGKVVRTAPPKEFMDKLRGLTRQAPSFDPDEAI